MSIEQHVLQQMLGEAALIRFDLTVALAKVNVEREKLDAEVKRLTEELKAAQDKLLYFEPEAPAPAPKKSAPRTSAKKGAQHDL